MPTLIEFLKNNSIDALSLSSDYIERLREGGIVSLIDLFSSLQMHKFGKSPALKGWGQDEIDVLNHAFKVFLDNNGLGKTPKPQEQPKAPIPALKEVIPPNKSKSQPVIEKPYQRILGSELLAQELIFQAKIRSIDLIGEIPISKNDLDALASLLKRIFSKHPATVATDAIEHGSPISFALFLVTQGVYGYAGGDYWTSVSNALDLNAHPNFGQIFERIIKKNRLPSFEELQKKSTKYVSLILAHGGIPVYSLDDYFSNLVLPSVIRPQYSMLEGQELIDALLSSSAVTYTDKPVIHFLEFGGRVALDIFNRSRQMLLRWQNSQMIPSSEEIGLPIHMVEHFSGWVQKQGKVVSAQKNSRSRFKKPEFCLDPWGTGVFLKLPGQSISVFDSPNCEWLIHAGQRIQHIPVATNAMGVTQDIILRLDTIANSYSVKFMQDKKEFEWIFKIPGYLFIFNPLTGVLQNRISNSEAWLVYPQNLELRIREGDGFQTEELPSLPGNWHALKAEGWDFSQARKITLTGDTIHEIEISNQEPDNQPTLVGGNLLKNNLDDTAEKVSIFIGRPPDIQIDLPEQANTNEILSRWRITIRPVGYADPELVISTQLVDLPDVAFTANEEYILIHLSHRKLLASRPIGTFQIAMIGPLGQDMNFTMTCLPECEIEGLDRLYIPGRAGAQAAPIEIQLGVRDVLQIPDGITGFKIQNTRPGIFSLAVPASVSRAKLQVVREHLDGEIVVPLDFRVLRLRWRLVTQDILENWSDELLNVSIPVFIRQSSPILIISLPGTKGEPPDLWLRMLDTNSNEIMKIFPAKRSSRHPGDFWRFDLSVLQTTLGESTAPIMRLELVAEKDGVGKIFELPVVSFTRAIDVRDVRTMIVEDEDRKTLKLTWKEGAVLENRAIFFWPLWRPWETPQMIAVPGNAKGNMDIVLDKERWPGGEYRLSFAIVDPWVNSRPSIIPPQEDVGGIYDFVFDPAERLTYLKEHAHSFSEHLELALISAAQNNIKLIAREIRWCVKNLRLASSQQILVLKNRLELDRQESLLQELGENIISPGVLTSLLENVQNEMITAADVGALLRYAPPSPTWTDTACELLFDFDDQRWRIEALRGLVTKKPQKAVKGALSLVKNGAIGIEDAVELLYENKPNVVEQLRNGYTKNRIAKKILELLDIYNPFSGLPMVRPGTWLRTDAGWGKIENIQDAVSHMSVDEFMENQGLFKLSVKLHIELDPQFQGERAVIDMKEKTISFPRAKQCYFCEHCREFIATGREMYRSHVALKHPGKYPSPPTARTSFTYNFLEFDYSRK